MASKARGTTPLNPRGVHKDAREHAQESPAGAMYPSHHPE
jgi:hypothetical protein